MSGRCNLFERCIKMKTKWTAAGLILASFMLIPGPAYAKVQDFMFSHDVSFAKPGEFYVSQALMDASRKDNTSNSRRSYAAVPINLAYGINERFEIGVEVPYMFLDNGVSLGGKAVTAASGLGDMSISQKLRLTDHVMGDWASSAFGYTVEIPTGSDEKGLGNGKTDLELFAVGLREVSFAKLLAGVGYKFVGGSSVDNELNYNVGLNAAFRPGLSLLMELNGISSTEDQFYVSPGVLFESQLGFSVRAGVQFGLGKESYKYNWKLAFSNSF